MKLLHILVLSCFLPLAAAAQDAPAPAFGPIDAAGVTLNDFLWLKRPIVVFADTPNDPAFQRQMQRINADLAPLEERDVVIITDTDPAARFARITAHGFDMAVREPQTVRVALRIDAVRQGLLTDGPLAQFGQDLTEGFATGRFAGSLDDGSLDLVLGTLLFAARRIVDGEHSPEYRTSILRRLLVALGITAEEAAALAADAVTATT